MSTTGVVAESDRGRSLARILRQWPWYVPLLALATILPIFSTFPVLPASALRILVVVSVVGLLTTLVWVVLLDFDRGGAAAAITVLGLLAAGDPARVALIVLAIVLLAIELRWSRSGRLQIRLPWKGITRGLNIFLAVLVVLQVGQAAVIRINLRDLEVPASWQAAPEEGRQDIYVLVADAHGRRDVLSEAYGYDSAQLVAGLTELGFRESPASEANHSETRFSLSVLLNGRPMSELGQDMAAEPSTTAAFEAVLGNSTIPLMESAGYETTVISSGYDHLPLRDVDRYIDTGPWTEVEQAALSATAIGKLFLQVTGAAASGPRDRVVDSFAALSEIVRTPSERPQIVFAHVPAPHWPFVFNADCSLRPEDHYTLGSGSRNSRKGDATAFQVTADQTRCLDGMLVDAAREIVRVRPDAVVVLLSDHGPEERLDWWDPQPDGIRDRMANLFWARTPGAADPFPDDISLVNVVPILANTYLGTDISLHANDLYMKPRDDGDTGRFVEVQPDGSRADGQ